MKTAVRLCPIAHTYGMRSALGQIFKNLIHETISIAMIACFVYKVIEACEVRMLYYFVVQPIAGRPFISIYFAF